jgi:hypothetical protein
VDEGAYLAIQTSMTRLAQNLDILVHPLRQEAHCMTVSEVVAVMGIPIIGGLRSGGILRTLAYGRTGAVRFREMSMDAIWPRRTCIVRR